MSRNRGPKSKTALIICALAFFPLVGCSAPSASAPERDTDTHNETVTPVGIWTAEIDDSIELQVHEDGTFKITPVCVLMGDWKETGDHFTVTGNSAIDIGGCPDAFAVDLALVDRFTVNGDTLVLSDSQGKQESFHLLSNE